MRAPDPNILHRRNRELSILNHIAAALNGSLNLNEALQSTLGQVAELLDLHSGWIWLLREETGEPYLAASHALPPALACDPSSMEGWCYCLDTFGEGDLDRAANINVITCSRLKHLIDGTDGLRYHASIPLYAQERKIGLMNVASADWCKLAADDLRLLHTVGDLLGMAIERAQLFDRSVAAGATEERNRLARELHDTLAQGLTAVVLQLETADLLLEMGSPAAKVRERISQALALTRASLDEARRSVLDLRAAPLEGRTLAQALAALGREASPEHPAVSVEVVGAQQPLPLRIEVGLYRIAQEAITNSLRHGAASKIALALAVTPAQVELRIEDDGVGFDPVQLVSGHFGLVGMNERARLLGGAIRIHSSPGAGTQITISVPLGAAA